MSGWTLLVLLHPPLVARLTRADRGRSARSPVALRPGLSRRFALFKGGMGNRPLLEAHLRGLKLLTSPNKENNAPHSKNQATEK